MVDYENKLYLIQSNYRTSGQHGKILDSLAKNSDVNYDMHFIINKTIKLLDKDGHFKGYLNFQSFGEIDSRYISLVKLKKDSSEK